MDRRMFARCCSGGLLLPALGAFASESMEKFGRVQLVTADGSPLHASDVPLDEALVFAYPYQGVPCYLVDVGDRETEPQTNLESPDDGTYHSPMGVGPRESLVAFVAICTHQLSYPTPRISYLRYASDSSELAGSDGKIVCCAHGSVFDPAEGGRNIAGPTQYPLIPVHLEYDAEADCLYATGTIGGKFFQRFFDAYKSDLIDRYGPGQYRVEVEEHSEAVRLSEYSKRVGSC